LTLLFGILLNKLDLRKKMAYSLPRLQVQNQGGVPALYNWDSVYEHVYIAPNDRLFHNNGYLENYLGLKFHRYNNIPTPRFAQMEIGENGEVEFTDVRYEQIFRMIKQVLMLGDLLAISTTREIYKLDFPFVIGTCRGGPPENPIYPLYAVEVEVTKGAQGEPDRITNVLLGERFSRLGEGL